MPELPDVELYLEALSSRVIGAELKAVRIQNPFVLRSVEPPIQRVDGKRVTELRRLGKRIVFGLEGELFLVIHLMRSEERRVGKECRSSGSPGQWSKNR